MAAHVEGSFGGGARLMGLALALLAPFSQAEGLADTATEYQVKAAFLFNFAKFVEWPPDTFPTSSVSFDMCIYGSGVVGEALQNIVKDKTVNGRPLLAKRVTSAEAAQTCQILFIPGERTNYQALLAGLRGRTVLTVGDTERFVKDGGTIAFTLQANRLRFIINTRTAEAAHLRISSRLLSLAIVVDQ